VTVAEYARYLLQYIVADNAPPALRTLRQLTKGSDLRLALTALAANATDRAELPPLEEMAQWLAARPTAYPFCDEILATKKPPRTWAELVERSYKTAHQDVVDRVRNWIKQELARA
jgi:hypothetical protein